MIAGEVQRGALPCSSCRTCSGIQGGTGRIVFWTSDIAWVLVGPRNQSGVTGYGAFAYIPACASQLASRNHLVMMYFTPFSTGMPSCSVISLGVPSGFMLFHASSSPRLGAKIGRAHV